MIKCAKILFLSCFCNVSGTLPYLQGGQALKPAQRRVRISSAQFASPNVAIRLQVMAIKPWMAVKP